jgi:predicted DNA binding CopG/RHH family protein
MKKTKYSKTPKKIAKAIEESVVIDDFLPSPSELVKKEKSVKVTIALSENSIIFFKQKAKKLGVPYQSMIKSLLDKYSEKYGS